MTRKPDDDHRSAPTLADAGTERARSGTDSLADLVSFSSQPPPPGDIHNACTTVTELPYTLLESMKSTPIVRSDVNETLVDQDELLASLEAMYDEDERTEQATVILEDLETDVTMAGSDTESAVLAALEERRHRAPGITSYPTRDEALSRSAQTLPPAAPAAASVVRSAPVPRVILLAGLLVAAMTAASASAALVWALVHVLYS